MATTAPTSVTNRDGSVTNTFYDNAGKPTGTVTIVTNQDGSKTQTRRDPAGTVTGVFNLNPSGKLVSQLTPNSDGTTDLTQFTPDGGHVTTTYGPDGTTPVAKTTRDGATGAETTTYLNPDGTPKGPPTTQTQQQQTDAGNAAYAANLYKQAADPSNPQLSTNSGGLGNWLLNPKAAVSDGKAAAKDAKGYLDQLNPVGTPGLNNGAVTDKLLGGDQAGGSVFSNDDLGKLLGTVAGYYGLGGLTGGSGTGSPGAAGGGTNGSGIDTSPISAAAAASKAMQDKFLAEYNAAHPNQPPVMNAAQLPPAVLAQMPEAIRPGHAEATLLDPTMQAQQRAGQLGLEQTIQDAITGNAPSVAQLQLQQALQTNEANQLGLASKASGGGNVALALRTAANNTGRLNQGASADAALLRAKEIADARAQLGGVLDQTRGADISLADKNAGLATHVSETNAGLDTSAATSTAQLRAAAEAANAKSQNDMAVAQGGFTQGANQNNQQAALTQQQIDAAAKQAAAANALSAGGQVITGTVGAADAQAKAVAAAQAAKAAADAKQAAGLGALSSTVAAWLGSGKTAAAPAYGNGPVNVNY